MDFIPTNLVIERQYPKLVRDNIPEIIEKKTGKPPSTSILADDDQFLHYLLKKMVEEATELEHSIETDNMQEELADIFELITAILKLKHWTIEDIITVQQEKRLKNGGFNKRILLNNIEQL